MPCVLGGTLRRQGSVQWARLKAEQEKEALQQCTFTPSVNESKDAHTPLHRRLQELQRQRRCLPCTRLFCSHGWRSPCPLTRFVSLYNQHRHT